MLSNRRKRLGRAIGRCISILVLAGGCLTACHAVNQAFQSATPPASAGDIAPGLEAELDQQAAAYKQIGLQDIARLAADCDKMVAAIEANDLEAARAAWLDARIYYERSEVFTFKFPYLIGSIDPWPDASSGFHAVEEGIFNAGSPPPLAEARELADKVHTLQNVFASQPLYAHGVLVGMGALAFQIGDSKALQDQSATSGASLSDLQHNVEGIETAWDTVFAGIMRARNNGIGERVEKKIAEVKALLAVPSFKDIDTAALSRTTKQLDAALSDTAVDLGWRQPNFTETDD
jgi:iron uptake system component EfeO